MMAYHPDQSRYELMRSSIENCSIGCTLSCQAEIWFLQHFTELLTLSKLGRTNDCWLASKLHLRTRHLGQLPSSFVSTRSGYGHIKNGCPTQVIRVASPKVPSHQSSPDLIHPRNGFSIYACEPVCPHRFIAHQGRAVSIGTTIVNWLFGCRHRELSRAFTSENETYKVCLKCGARLRYSWQTMSLVREGANPRPAPAKAPLHSSETQRRHASGKR